MNRRTFFKRVVGAVAALISLPLVVKAKPKKLTIEQLLKCRDELKAKIENQSDVVVMPYQRGSEVLLEIKKRANAIPSRFAEIEIKDKRFYVVELQPYLRDYIRG